MRSRGGCGTPPKPSWHLRASTQAPGSLGQTLRVKVAAATAPPGGPEARCPASRASWAGRTRWRTAGCGAVCLFLTWVGTPWARGHPGLNPYPLEKLRTSFQNPQADRVAPCFQVLGPLCLQIVVRSSWIGWELGSGTFTEWLIKRRLSVAKVCADDWAIAQRVECPPSTPNPGFDSPEPPSPGVMVHRPVRGRGLKLNNQGQPYI